MGDIGDRIETESPAINFYIWPQNLAQTSLITILKTALLNSAPIYNRILAPHNTPTQHCLFAASIPSSGNSCYLPELYTVIFADRSHNEAQIWLHSSHLAEGKPMTANLKHQIQQHASSAFHFVRNGKIPESPGWPFSPNILFYRTQTEVADALRNLLNPYQAVEWDTNWGRFNIPLSHLPAVPTLPDGLIYESPVPEGQYDIVLSTSSIKRQKKVLMDLPSSSILDNRGNAVAWAFCGTDASLSTLYVVDAWRKKGLAKAVAADLLHKVRDEYDFPNLKEKYDAGIWKRERVEERKPFGRGSGYVFAEIKVGNTASERTMEWLGGRKAGLSRYVFVDSSKVPTNADGSYI